MRHPLLNPNSTHYHKKEQKSAIELLEQELSLAECIGYAKGNIIKYRYRLETKGQKESDLTKLESYIKYLSWLIGLDIQMINDNNINDATYRAFFHSKTLAQTLSFLEIIVEYKL